MVEECPSCPTCGEEALWRDCPECKGRGDAECICEGNGGEYYCPFGCEN